MATVYVTQETQHDFTAAENFGYVKFLTHLDLVNIRNSGHNESVLMDLSQKLRKFDPEEDYIVIAGSPYITAAVFMLLGLRRLKAVRILRWDNRDRKYIPLYLELRREVVVEIEAQS